MAEFGRQWRRWGVAEFQFTNRLNRLKRFLAEVVVERHLDARLAADVIKDALRDSDAQLVFQQHRLTADLDGIVVPVWWLAIIARGTGTAFVFDGIDLVSFLLQQIQFAGEPKPGRAEL